MLRYERRSDPLLPIEHFLVRILHTAGVAAAIVVFSLSVGILGYHYIQGLDWLDALLNASMILSGMGPVDPPKEPPGKWFASFYALFSGVVFITTAGVIIAPIAHRMLHWFHIKEMSDSSDLSDLSDPSDRSDSSDPSDRSDPSDPSDHHRKPSSNARSAHHKRSG
jgi:hypothetical protein